MGYKTADRVEITDALSDNIDSVTNYPKCSYTNITASTLIKTGTGQIYGVLVNSHTSGVIKAWDNTSAATTAIGGSIALPAVGTLIPYVGGTFGTGLFIELVSGTADLTILYR